MTWNVFGVNTGFCGKIIFNYKAVRFREKKISNTQLSIFINIKALAEIFVILPL